MDTRFRRWWASAKPRWWGSAPPPSAPEKAPQPPREPLKISQAALANLAALRRADRQPVNPYVIPTPPPGVRPAKDSPQMAMDEYPIDQVQPQLTWAGGFHGLWDEGIGFMGYPYLAALTQRPEYRYPSEIYAEEMTRKWIILNATGKEKSEKIKELTADMAKFRLRETFRDATELDGFLGLGFIMPDFGLWDDPEELSKKLTISPAKIEKGSLKGFTVIDPTWCSPNQYNANNPMDPTFYRPQQWWVMGKMVHASRLLAIISRPLPDILKPAYNFGGLSLSQMLKPYVDNWLRTRQSVSDLLNAFTVFDFETDMMSTLAGGNGGDLAARIQAFTTLRNNMGLFVHDKESEAFSNISAPLGTLDHLQAQAQEHMASAARIPLVKLFGISPSGLNSSTDGEVRTFYDSIHGRQERVYTEPLKTCLDILQLNRYGEIDPEITFEFVSLWELDEAAQAAVEKTKAETAEITINTGAVDYEEWRQKLADDPKSQFHGLTGPAPGPPEQPDEGDDPSGGGEALSEPRHEERSGV